MYDETEVDSSAIETAFTDYDAWLDSKEGWDWVEAMADAHGMRFAAETFGARAGLGSTWEGW